MPELIDSWSSGGFTYKTFFNLSKKPFDLLPNPDFLFLSKSHKRALSYLDYGIRERVGFILLTGEVGSGKTTIIRDLINKHLDDVVLSKVFNTKVDSEQLMAMINDDFGLPVKDKDKITLWRELNEFLIAQYTKGTRPVLIVDEAQNLAPELLEEIRMLSNLETDNAKLLQIILVGQPELRKTLSTPEMVQLRQRISINCHLRPLSKMETEQYILHRLERAGNRDAATFHPETLNLIFRYSRGIPRLINVICDFLLLSAFAEETKDIDTEMVKDLIQDLDFDNHFWGIAPACDQASAHGGNEMPEQTSVGDNQFMLFVRDINERLDNLGKHSDTLNQALSQEMTKKISVLTHSLESYREVTDSLISRNFAASAHEPMDEESRNEKYMNVAGRFLKRLLGSGSSQ